MTYLTVATRRKPNTNAFRPVWLPSSKVQDSAPTLGGGIAYLRDLTRTLQARMEDTAKLANFLESFEQTPLEEIEEVRCAVSLLSTRG